MVSFSVFTLIVIYGLVESSQTLKRQNSVKISTAKEKGGELNSPNSRIRENFPYNHFLYSDRKFNIPGEFRFGDGSSGNRTTWAPDGTKVVQTVFPNSMEIPTAQDWLKGYQFIEPILKAPLPQPVVDFNVVGLPPAPSRPPPQAHSFEDAPPAPIPAPKAGSAGRVDGANEPSFSSSVNSQMGTKIEAGSENEVSVSVGSKTKAGTGTHIGSRKSMVNPSTTQVPATKRTSAGGSDNKQPGSSKSGNSRVGGGGGSETEVLVSVGSKSKTKTSSTSLRSNQHSNASSPEEKDIQIMNKSAPVPQPVPKPILSGTDYLKPLLRGLRFFSKPGNVNKDALFETVPHCGLFLEPTNVSEVSHSWSSRPFSPYFYTYEVPQTPYRCKTSAWMNQTDMHGALLGSFPVKQNKANTVESGARLCEKVCCQEPLCAAWVLREQTASTDNCRKGTLCCWLKTSAPQPEYNPKATAGIIRREHFRPPPAGIRSAVPLGGLGTGSFEIRADGSFHEWTVENQSPGGSAKLGPGALQHAMFAVWSNISTGNRSWSSLRTSPPDGLPGVENIEYQGSFPVSKLTIESKENFVATELYAFSSVLSSNLQLSALPAVYFVAELTNRASQPSEASLLLTLPLGFQQDTVRRGSNMGEVAFSRHVGAAECAVACRNNTRCLSWTTNGQQSCMLKDGIPLHAFEAGISSGIKGVYDVGDNMLTLTRPGFFPQSGETTLLALGDQTDQTSLSYSDDLKSMLESFGKNGTLPKPLPSHAGLHAAVSVKTTIPARSSRLVGVVMAWYYPNRDLSGERVGNIYSQLYASSTDVAITANNVLSNVLEDVARLHQSMGPSRHTAGRTLRQSVKHRRRKVSKLPIFVQDMLLNSISFMRSGIWMEDGRWRQWETYDCANLNTVYVDFQRAIPYLVFYPDMFKDLLRSWARHQKSDGMIPEALAIGCLRETTSEGSIRSRAMTDNSASFLAALFLTYSWTNDTELLVELYPAAVRASVWMAVTATRGTGLPYRVPNTYDLLEMEKFDHNLYSSVFYLLGLKAMQAMALLMRDESALNFCREASVRATKLIDVEFWDEAGGFYHAWWDAEWGSPDWIMADSLYPQMWSFTLGLGSLVHADRAKLHLKEELRVNQSPFGLKIMSRKSRESNLKVTIISDEDFYGCHSLDNITRRESVWTGSSLNWAALQIYLGANVDLALEEGRKTLNHFRNVLHDKWNIPAVISSEGYGLDGLPWAIGHHSHFMNLWHIPLALSGQYYYAPTGLLTFEPRLPIPYDVPFFTPVAVGQLQARLSHHNNNSTEIQYSVTVNSGYLKLQSLVVSGVSYPGISVEIQAPQSVTWSVPFGLGRKKLENILLHLK